MRPRLVSLATLFLLSHGAPSVGTAVPRIAPTDSPRSAVSAPGIIDNTGRMDVNNLDMVVTNHGSIAYDLMTGNAGLIYPKGGTRAVIFAAGPWIGAKVNGSVRVAIGEYSQEFVPGPMAGGSYLPDAIEFRSYRIDRGGAGFAEYLAYAVPQGAPLDAQGNPLLSGDATIWNAYNDANPLFHWRPPGATAPLGVEVQQTVFAFNRAGPLGNAIFVKFRLANKGGATLEDAYFSMWADPDLGGYTDDLSGCDPQLDLAYAYNGTNADGQYGSRPPAVGFHLVRGPVVNRPSGARDTLGMTAFVSYLNGQDPSNALEVYNFMLGLRADGSPIQYVDPILGPTVTTFDVSGDPVAGTGFLDTNPADRRFLLSSGPFRMAPGDLQEIVFAIIVGQGTDRLSSVSSLRASVPLVSGAYPGRTVVHEADLDVDPDVIQLASRAPWITAYIEPRGFELGDVDLASIRLGGAASAAGKSIAVVDHDDDALMELMVKFDRAGLDPLFAPGAVTLAVTGALADGSTFRGTDEIRVIEAPAGPPEVSIAPNPLNPSGRLRFEMTAAGFARVAIFDPSGRLVGVPLDREFLPAGVHVVRIEGRGRAGQVLGSGVYFYRVETEQGSATGRFTLLK